MMEATLLLAMIQQKFHLEIVPGHPIEIFASVTLRPKYGIRVIPHRRTTGEKYQSAPSQETARQKSSEV